MHRRKTVDEIEEKLSFYESTPWVEWRAGVGVCPYDIYCHAGYVEGTEHDIPDSVEFADDAFYARSVDVSLRPTLAPIVLARLQLKDFESATTATVLGTSLSPMTSSRLRELADECERKSNPWVLKIAFVSELLRRGEYDLSKFESELEDANEHLGFTGKFSALIGSVVYNNPGPPASKYDLRANQVVAGFVRRLLAFSARRKISVMEGDPLRLWFENDRDGLNDYIRRFLASAKLAPEDVKVLGSGCVCERCAPALFAANYGDDIFEAFLRRCEKDPDAASLIIGGLEIGGFSAERVERLLALLARFKNGAAKIPTFISWRYGRPVAPPPFTGPRAAHSANFATETDTIL